MSKGKQPRKLRSEADLIAMAHHLAYEVETAVMAGVEATWPVLSDEGQLRRNLGVEGFAVHARSLLHFLTRIDADEDDVLAVDYRPDPAKWPSHLPRAELDTLGRKTGKQVAHLTWHRLIVTPQERQWNIDVMMEELACYIQAFSDAVDPKFLGPHRARMARAFEWYRDQNRGAFPSWGFGVQGLPTTSSHALTITSLGPKAIEDLFALQVVGIDDGPLS